MNNNKLLSIIEKIEKFSKIINKKLNTNQVSKKIESFIKRKESILVLLSLKNNMKKLKLLYSKKITLPDFLTAANLIQEIKKIIKNKYDLGFKFKKDRKKPNKKKTNRISSISLLTKLKLRLKNNLLYKEKLINIINKFISRLESVKNISIQNPILNKAVNLDKESHNLAVAVYNEHCLTLASVIINRNNKVFIKGVIEVPIPGDIIGDSCVEDKQELSNIILDLLCLLKLERSPLLIILSSSLFKINTFLSSELKQISNTDNKVQSKSPYLPNDTFVEFRNMSNNDKKDKLIRTVYTSRKLIESWTDTLEILNNPIIGITPSVPNIFDMLGTKITEKITILIDIERTTTMAIVGRDSINLTSHKLPYGSSLYSSDDDIDLSENYFSRLLSSLNLIMSEYNEVLPSYIYIYGKGLDDLLKNNTLLPSKFKKLSDMKLANFSYTPNQMQTHELVSNSIYSTIETLSLITSCL